MKSKTPKTPAKTPADQWFARRRRWVDAVAYPEPNSGDSAEARRFALLWTQARDNPLSMGAKAVWDLTTYFMRECADLKEGGRLRVVADELERWRDECQLYREHRQPLPPAWHPRSLVFLIGYALSMIALDWGLPGSEEIEDYADDLQNGLLDTPHDAGATAALGAIMQHAELRQLREKAQPPQVPLVDDGEPFHKPAYFTTTWKLSGDCLLKRHTDATEYTAGKIRRRLRPALGGKGKRLSYEYSEPDARKCYPEKFIAKTPAL